MQRDYTEEMTERLVLALERVAAAVERLGEDVARVAPAVERSAAVLEVFGAGVVEAGDESATPAPCVHPEDKRVDRSVMGRMQWTCKVCGFEFSRSAAELAATEG